jgi:diaminohydroxyphosphoribosylaminopyrimidine deaminase/5-amino-6-(5-phosphoribosylamino)uracil reductase|tara:strand:- start:1487 stop:2572 length:1086 start_codon:yes stop_codon:yes gene_type:complete
MSQESLMARALLLAERGVFTTAPNPRVGCVIVKNEVIIAEGWHHRAGEAHAEVNALLQLNQREANGADCYITLEPCSHDGRTPPCCDAIIKAGIKRVIIAMKDPNPMVAGRGIEKLKQVGIVVVLGVLEEQAEKLNQGFCQRMRMGRPYIRSKLAMSVDGKTAMASGESQWITSQDARQDVQKLRAQSSVILTGIGTVLNDDPSLSVRPGDWYPQGELVRQPLRVVIDSNLRIPLNAKILNSEAETLVVSIKPSDKKGVNVMVIQADRGHVDLKKLMNRLAEREINDVMVEAGSKLNGALVQAGLVDELVIYMAPKLLGDSAQGLFHLPALQKMSQNIALNITDIRAVGSDWRITASPIYG